MKILMTFLLLTAGFFSFSQFSGFKKVADPKEIAEKLNAASKKTKSIDSDFKQYKHLDILENDIESSGHFSFKATDKVRWEYLQPYKYLIVMNGKDMWINDGNKIRKYDTESNKMFKEINNLMVGMLQGNILKSENFEIIFYENKNEILAVLKPKSPEMKDFLEHIELYFDNKHYNVKKIIMDEPAGDYTEMIFYNRKMNIEIPDSRFLIK